MFLINGYKQESLAVSDRATQFGDGCFTTARVIDGKVSLLSAHIQRLQDACQRLMISCDFWPQLEQWTGNADSLRYGLSCTLRPFA